MTLLAATTTATGSSTGPILAFALVLVIGYAIACVIWPFRACRHCEGTGRFLSPTGRAWRHCLYCEGTGARLRLSRWIFNHLAQRHGRDRTQRRR